MLEWEVDLHLTTWSWSGSLKNWGMKCATGWCQWIKWCHFLLSSLDEICTVWCLPSQSVVRQEQFSADCRLTSISCSSDDFLHLLTLATLLNNQWTPTSISFFLLVNCFGVWDSSYLANQSLCWYPILISVGVSVLISDYLGVSTVHRREQRAQTRVDQGLVSRGSTYSPSLQTVLTREFSNRKLDQLSVRAFQF